MSLSEALELLSGRLDATFIILLDRFEALLEAPSDRAGIVEFANELVESINREQLPANFLISLNEADHPRLAMLRNRIPGFDNFSLKLARPQTFAPTTLAQNRKSPAAVAPSALPVLNQSPTLPDKGPKPLRTVVKRPPLPRVPVKTEDVYAFIEATLAHTATEVPSEPFLAAGRARASGMLHLDAPAGRPHHPPDADVASTRAAKTGSAQAFDSNGLVQTRGPKLDAAIKWVRQHWRPNSKPDS
jgi:hypothetical protein